MPSKKVVLIFAVTYFSSNLVQETFAYGSGAPNSPSVCEKMLPGHGAEPQKSASPFGISLSSSTVRAGQKLTFTLTAPAPNFFRGFLAIVKKPGNAKTAYGTFDKASESKMKVVGCFDGSKNAATHSSAEDKKKVVLEWTAPQNTDVTEFELVVTFVRTFSEIWQAVRHPQKITLTK